jgi:hypoxanthine phosphoribosyltransferase
MEGGLKEGTSTLPDGGTVLLTNDHVQAAVGRLAGQVERWLEDQRIRNLTLVVVLEGAQPLAADLVSTLRVRLPGLKVTAQGVRMIATDGKTLLPSREMAADAPLPKPKEDECILIVDDLLDSGKTLAFLRERLKDENPERVKTAVLIHKFKDAPFRADFCAVDLAWDRRELTRQGLKDRWLFGYGMDLDGQYRELDIVGTVNIPAR